MIDFFFSFCDQDVCRCEKKMYRLRSTVKREVIKMGSIVKGENGSSYVRVKKEGNSANKGG